MIDEKDIIRSFSAPAVHIFGWSQDVVGMNVSSLMPQLYWPSTSCIERYQTNGARHIIGFVRIVVGERSDDSTSVGDAKVRAERFFIGLIRNLAEVRAQKWQLQELRSELVHVSRLSAMGEMASSFAREIDLPSSAITHYMPDTKALLPPDKPEPHRIGDALEHAAQMGSERRFLQAVETLPADIVPPGAPQ
ncbi:hypothetical protein A1D31_35630 [Bradyrhizobium liaoningense]|nr:hypothetical protein A1D31_35630 [Bradyrhizobium liaoningense]